MAPFVLDVHTHTISSGHYTNDTITDMAKAANQKGLKLLGISEHGPALPNSCSPSYFRGLPLAPALRMGVHMLYGAEVNIIDYNGKLDLSDDIMTQLDYCIAGMHLPCLSPGTIRENTDAYIHAMKNPSVYILAHPDDPRFPVDYDRLVRAAIDHHVLLEINNNSLAPGSYRGNTNENNRMILELCRKYQYPVLLSSDSHGHEHIGDFQFCLDLINKIHFPPELILNSSVDKFLNFIRN